MKPPRLRERPRYWHHPDKEWLEYQYLILKKSIHQISREVGASRLSVGRWLDSMGIVRRGAGEAISIGAEHRSYHCKSWLKKKARETAAEVGLPMCCEICGQGPPYLVVHHRDGNQENYGPENLQRLCESCHRWIHKEMGRTIAEELINAAQTNRV